MLQLSSRNRGGIGAASLMIDDTPLRLSFEREDYFERPSRAEQRDLLFEGVTAKYNGLIARIALSHEADPGLRRDLVQDILLAVWLALDKFRGESSLKTFVASIAQKRSISHVTRRAREPRQEELPDSLVSAAMSPDEIAVQNDLKRRLLSSIRKLPLPQREAIVLCFEGFSYGEIGEVLGISANAAMLRCGRAKASLKEVMDRRN
jgi:RNA polymerase sigma factor (sigma-70 family)